MSLIANVVVGIVGAYIGGFLFTFLSISTGGFIGAVITATVGAALLLYVVGRFKKG